MKYLKPEEILNNPDYVQIKPKTYVWGVSNVNDITHYTCIPFNDDGWEAVLYYRFVGSITQDQPQNT